MSDESAPELYRRYRPKLFKEVIGQPEAIEMLDKFLKSNTLPHALLLTGSSGCGKTSIARILKAKLKCGDNDFNEINAADFRGIDTVRDIRQRMGLAPIEGECRIWLIDEAHQVTSQAQAILLKLLEDTPSHVYFMLATTDPGKLLPTIKTRCTEIKVKSLSIKDMKALIESIAEKEKKVLEEEVVDRIIEVADGSARKALVLLGQVIKIEETDKQLDCILSSDSKRQAIEIARCLMNPRGNWGEMAKILKDIEEEPESLRYMILGYATSVLLGGGKLAGRAFQIINTFESNFYDSKKAGLVRACYEVMNSK